MYFQWVWLLVAVYKWKSQEISACDFYSCYICRKKEVETEILKADDPKLKEYVEDELYDKLQEDNELLDMAGNEFSL